MITLLVATLLSLAQDKEIQLVRIEPGEFVMGAGDAPPRTKEEWLQRDWDESPAHKVKISRAFLMSTTEVTNAQFRAFEPTWKGPANDPVVHVTWAQAAAFCDWLSKKDKKPYRLPTEAEWEYACRAGSKTAFSTGDALDGTQANLKGTILSVGTYPPNAWGLHDMHGNVAEWCLDWYGPYDAADQVDPVGRSDGDARVVRGGNFLMGNARFCRSANRSGQLPEDPGRATGFRVVQGELPATAPLPVVAVTVKQDPAPKDGPDPSKPFFVDYAKDKKNPTIPKESWGPIFSAWNHFTTVCVCPNGDVLAAWYTTVAEEGRELCQASSRLRAGSDAWDPATLFYDTADMNDHAPVLLRDGKRLWHFFTQSLKGWDDATDVVRFSDDSGATWSKPRIMVSRDDPHRLSQPCSAYVAKDGTIVLACDGDNHRDERLVTSSDGGKTWTVAAGDMRKSYGGKYVIHPAIVPRADGSTVSFLRGPDPMPMLVSTDLGATWTTEETPFSGIGVGQKAAAVRLASGAILLVSIDLKKKTVGGGTFAALSVDDGKTWPHVRKVEGVTGYMSATQGSNGVIHVFGTKMSCVSFNEAWIKEGK